MKRTALRRVSKKRAKQNREYTETKPMIWLLLERGREIGSFDSQEEAIEERELRCGINQRDNYRIIQSQ